MGFITVNYGGEEWMGHRASSISTHTPANINNKLTVFINDFSSTALSLTTAPCRGRRTSELPLGRSLSL